MRAISGSAPGAGWSASVSTPSDHESPLPTCLMELGPGPEFDRIRRIAERLGPRAAPLGDDCALLRVGDTRRWPSAPTSRLKDVHFRRSWMTDREIGWRATAAALSDLAAEGPHPRRDGQRRECRARSPATPSNE